MAQKEVNFGLETIVWTSHVFAFLPFAFNVSFANTNKSSLLQSQMFK